MTGPHHNADLQTRATNAGAVPRPEHESTPAARPGEAVETFVYEVSAGRVQGAGPVAESKSSAAAQRPAARGAAPQSRPAKRPASGRPARIDADHAPRRPAASPSAASVSFKPSPLNTTVSEGVIASRPKRSYSIVRICLSTAVLHAVLLVGLGLVTIAHFANEIDLTLLSEEPLSEVLIDDLAELTAEVEPLESLDDVVEPAEFTGAEFLEQGGPTLGEVSSAEALAEMVGPGGLGEVGFGDIGGMFDGAGQGLAGEAVGPGDMSQAEFFGLKIDGRRIVFILDNSASMQGGRLETVIAELRRCVDALTMEQEFYVVFYSDAVYPLFYPDPAMQFVQPTDRNKNLLAEWLDTVELCYGDTVDQALAAAASIGPDNVILLSDGKIYSQRKLQYLLAAQTRDFPIHTVAIGMGRATAGRANLELIAETNGGTFRESPISPEMRELALRRPRPYHSDEPGEIWGRNVKRSWR